MKKKINQNIVDTVFLPLLEKMDLTSKQQKEIMLDVKNVLIKQESTIYESPNFVTGLQEIPKKMSPSKKMEELEKQIRSKVVDWKVQDEKLKEAKKVLQNKLDLIHKKYGSQQEVHSNLLNNKPQLTGLSDVDLQVLEISAEEKYEANVKKGLRELEGEHFHDPMFKQNDSEMIAIQVIDLAKTKQKFSIKLMANVSISKKDKLKQLRTQAKGNKKSVTSSTALKL